MLGKFDVIIAMTSPDINSVTVDLIEQDLRRNVVNKEYVILFSNDPDRVSAAYDVMQVLTTSLHMYVMTVIFSLLCSTSLHFHHTNVHIQASVRIFKSRHYAASVTSFADVILLHV